MRPPNAAAECNRILCQLEPLTDFAHDHFRRLPYVHCHRILRLFEVGELAGQEVFTRKMSLPLAQPLEDLIVGTLQIDERNLGADQESLPIDLFQGRACHDDFPPLCYPLRDFSVKDLQPWRSLGVPKWNPVPHFLHVLRRMKRVAVHKLPAKFRGQQMADRRLSRPRRPHEQHDHGSPNFSARARARS